MQVRGVPRISCIRSYDAPRGNPDTALNYEWSMLEAAMATCARHPYSPPVRIQDDIDLTTIIPCRDPSLMGHSNPIRLAAAEAGCLFDKANNSEKTPPVYISLGAGKPKEEEFWNAAKEVRAIGGLPSRRLIRIMNSALTRNKVLLPCFTL